MKTIAMTLIVLGAALAALPASAQESGQTNFTLIAENPEFVWKNEAGVTNPELVVPAGAQVTVTIRNDEQEGFHAFAIVGGDKSEDIMDANAQATFTFTAPESGSVKYNCPYHPSTMEGTVRVAGSPAPGGSDGDNESPGIALVGVLMALVGVALFARRK